MTNLLKPSAMMLAAVLALSLGLAGTAVAAPPTLKLTAGKVKKIAKKQIAKAAPSLAVAKAANADALGGRTLGQLQPVLAGAQNNAFVLDIGAGIDTVTVNYTLAEPSRVNFSGTVELQGDGNDLAGCSIQSDGVDVSLFYETSFDDANPDNSSVVALVTSVASVPAGAHVAVVRCGQLVGTGDVSKDDAALNLIAVPN